MIITQEIKFTGYDNNRPKTAIATLFADTREEVENGNQIIGFPLDCEMQANSMVVTAVAEVAIMQTNGIWKWLTKDESAFMFQNRVSDAKNILK